MKFYIRTLGCKMNQLDTARVTAALRGAGHIPVANEAEAECILVNSCTVTAESDRKSRQAANAATRSGSEVAVLGCGPRADPASWKAKLPDTLQFESEDALLAHFGADQSDPVLPIVTRSRVPVAIQSGCDDACSYCITRVARGGHLSYPIEAVLDQIRDAERQGAREVVLTGINLASWGCEDTRRPEQTCLHALLREILEQTTIPRIRLSSLGPQYLVEGFFELFSEPRLCDHLHLSVQSGSPEVLERMQRGHCDRELFRVAEIAREIRPDCALTADFIVGFPGETENQFADTLAMVETIGFAKLHVFPFSVREGTPAARLPGQLDGREKKRRAAELRALGNASRKRFIEGQLGKRHQVLLEDDGTGLTGNYIRLRVDGGGAEGEFHQTVVSRERIADRW